MADLELLCEVCGQPVELGAHSRAGVAVTPCSQCLSKEREQGREEGYNQGLAEGSNL